MYGGKFAFPNRLGLDWKEFTVFALFYFVCEGNFQVQAPVVAYIRRGDLMEGFSCYRFVGLIFGGAYFWNFTVCGLQILCISFNTVTEFSSIISRLFLLTFIICPFKP